MPRVSEEITSFNFTGGFITEASPLNFPENSSLDESNFELNRDGSRSRRLGVDYESSYTLNSVNAATNVETKAINQFVWKSVGNDGDLTFLVIQEGSILHFHDISAEGANSANKKGFTVDVSSYKNPNVATAGNLPLDFSSGLGRLVCVSNEIEPIVIEYNSGSDTVSVTQINIQIRDFEGLDDGLDPETRSSSISAAHRYNLYNQGWPNSARCFDNEAGSSSSVTNPVDNVRTHQGFYPSNSDIFYLGKSTSADQTATIGSFSSWELRRSEIRIGQAPRGRFIVNAFSTNRSSVSGVGGITETSTDNRPSSCTFFYGRIFYAVDDKVYFSQTIRSTDQLGKCYQQNDPTAEEINALLDTDGGVIPFPEAGSITALVATQDSLFVFSNIGVWQIRGVEGKFVATEFTIKKVVKVGTDSHRNVLEVEGSIMFLSDSGIYVASEDRVSGAFQAQNLTERSIQTFYTNISREAIANSNITYDSVSRKVYLLYNSTLNFDATEHRNRYTDLLIFDLALSSFYKYSISALDNNSPYIYGAYLDDVARDETVTYNVLDSDLDQVIDSNTDTVIENIITPILRVAELKLITIVPNGSSYQYTFSEFSNSNFVDWETADGTGEAYTSYLETGYQVLDGARYKQGTYLITHFNRTETEFVDNGSGGVAFNNPSGCIGRVKWEWTSSSSPNRWSSEQQLYRFPTPFVAGNIGELFDYGYDVITTKSKIRGKGRALHLRFESEEGKDCQLLGWTITLTGNSAP